MDLHVVYNSYIKAAICIAHSIHQTCIVLHKQMSQWVFYSEIKFQVFTI